MNKKTNKTYSKVQQSVTSIKKSNFSFDLCKALMSSIIPLHKISNINFGHFWKSTQTKKFQLSLLHAKHILMIAMKT